MIMHSQDTDMKHNLKTFKELISINNYLSRYMSEYFLMKSNEDNYMIAYGKGKLDFGERIIIIRTKLWTDEVYIKDSVEFDKSTKEFRVTKAMLYPGDGFISVVLMNTGDEIELPINDLDEKMKSRILEEYHFFDITQDPLKLMGDFQFQLLSGRGMLSLRNNRTVTEIVDGKALVFSKKLLGSLNTTKDASYIYLANKDSGMEGRILWCIREDIWEEKEDKGVGLPYMETYMIVYAIDLLHVKGRE